MKIPSKNKLIFTENVNFEWSQTLETSSINPCAAEFVVSIFHSFEAEIVNEMSSFNWRNICLFMKNVHLQNRILWLTEHLSQTFLWISVAFH